MPYFLNKLVSVSVLRPGVKIWLYVLYYELYQTVFVIFMQDYGEKTIPGMVVQIYIILHLQLCLAALFSKRVYGAAFLPCIHILHFHCIIFAVLHSIHHF